MEAWLEEMKAVQERPDVNLREMKSEIRANNEKFEVLQGTLVSRMDPPSQDRAHARKKGRQPQRKN
jgi:hypothetical protein